MIKINDSIVWECLNPQHIINIAKDLGYKEEIDYTELDKIRVQKENLLWKHGLNPCNCCFDEEILGEDDYNEYYRLEREREEIKRKLNWEYVDDCIDWLMENGYKLKISRSVELDKVDKDAPCIIEVRDGEIKRVK